MKAKALLKRIHAYMEEDIYSSLGRYRNPHARDIMPRVDVVLASLFSITILRLALAPILGEHTAFLVFLFGVIGASWFAGFWAGFGTLLLASIIETVIVSKGTWQVEGNEYGIAASLFVVLGSLIAFLIASLARARVKRDELTLALTAERSRLSDAYGRLENVLESISDGFALVNDEGRFSYVNRPTGLFLEKPQRELLGKDIKDELADAYETFRVEFERVAKERVTGRVEVFLPPKKKWFLLYLYPVTERDVALYAIDITETKKEEQRKDTLVSVASHELKTPIASAKLFAGILHARMDKGDERVASYMQKVEQELDRLQGLVTSLLDLSGVKNATHISPIRVHLSALAQEVAEELGRVISTHRIETSIAPEVFVLGHDERLRQVFRNLLTNAVKYSPGKDRVELLVAREGDGVRISVRDSGVGIQPQHRDKIFEPFFQVGHVSPSLGNVGLGLSIVREIVERHGGKIWVESSPPQGSVFHIYLPKTEEV